MKEMIGYCGLDCEKCDAYLPELSMAIRPCARKLQSYGQS